MTERRPARTRPQALAVATVAALLPLALTSCGSLPDVFHRGGGTAEPGTGTVEEAVTSYGPCLPVYGGGVLSVSTNQAGQALFVSDEQPADWPADNNWDSDWRSVNIFTAKDHAVRNLAHTWAPLGAYPVAATPEPGQSPASGPEIIEQPDTIRAALATDDFALGTVVLPNPVGFVHVYTGKIQADVDPLTGMQPDQGLTLVPLNDPTNNENVRLFAISDKGGKVAAVVGSRGEIRIWDIGAQQATVYQQADTGVRVLHDVPAPTDKDWNPAYATLGVVYPVWSPDESKLALSRAEASGKSSISILDVASGELTHVATYDNSTVPFVQWHPDGQQLDVMRTPVTASGAFGDTKFLTIAAVKEGATVSTGEMARQQGYKSEPSLLTRVTDDEFLFTWEGGLWRMTTVGGDMGEAKAIRVTDADQMVPYEAPAGLPEQDMAVFRSMTKRGDGQIGVREYLASDTCPISEDNGAAPQPTATP